MGLMAGGNPELDLPLLFYEDGRREVFSAFPESWPGRAGKDTAAILSHLLHFSGGRPSGLHGSEGLQVTGCISQGLD